MSEMKFTPGPWEVILNGNSLHAIAAPALCKNICIFPTVPDKKRGGSYYQKAWGEPMANARLISTAPMGYELAKRVVEFCKGDERKYCKVCLSYRGHEDWCPYPLAEQIIKQVEGE